MRTAINLFTVRELEGSMDEVLDRVAAAGYDGVQFSGGLRGASPGAVRETLDEVGLSATPAHVGIGQLENDLGETVETYGETIGCSGAVVPALDEETFATSDAVGAAARRLSELGDRLAARDWRLHYHNHAFEFTDLDGGTAFDRLVERSDDAVGVELDVGWALAGGEDPAALLSRLGDRVDLVHMKDVDVESQRPREIGEGDVDMQACADAARRAGADWLIYEHDAPDDPAASIEVGADYLETL
jgi:sugar phosphate isomerase/epimerase